MMLFREHGTILTLDGLRLFYCKDAPESPKALVVIAHGLAEHCGRYDYVTQSFNRAGYGVYRFDHRGHGRSGGKRADVDSLHRYLDDMDMVVEKARADYPGLPVFALGHNMGGLIAAGHEAKYPGKLRGHIFLGAAVRPMPVFCTDCGGDPASDVLPNTLGEFASHDRKVAEAYAADPLVLKFFSRRLADAVWKEGVAWVEDRIKDVVAPSLILHGGEDKLVPPEAPVWLHDALPASDKKLKIYPGLYHEILNEEEKDQVITDIVDWMNGRVRA